MSALVMDLGGTRLKAGMASSDGRIEKTEVADVPESGGRDALRDLLARTGESVLDGTRAGAAALCVPGLVDDGVLVSLPGKLAGLEGADLDALLRETFGVARAVVANDAVAYAIGETTAGAGRGCARVVVVTIGTGIGVTVVENGAPATGGMFGAGILGGFIPISSDDTGDSPRDSAGNAGTIEALCAAERIASGTEYASAPDVFVAHARGEAAARDAVTRYRARLARALVALAHAHAPERVVLGGGPMREGNPITPGLEEMVNDALYGTYRVEVRLAELGDEAALLGLGRMLDEAQ